MALIVQSYGEDLRRFNRIKELDCGERQLRAGRFVFAEKIAGNRLDLSAFEDPV